MIYLASPYSSFDPAMRERRFRAARQTTVTQIRAGAAVFSPVYGHVLAEAGLPSDWEFWEYLDQAWLARCDELIVLTLDGWEESVGVQAEILAALASGKRIRYVSPEVGS